MLFFLGVHENNDDEILGKVSYYCLAALLYTNIDRQHPRRTLIFFLENCLMFLGFGLRASHAT